MPLVDMPLDRLREYQGRNPRPSDFDDYWARALRELDETDPAVELIPHEWQSRSADAFHLYFTGVGGARVHAKYLRPRHAPAPHPAVLLFHGYAGHSGDWAD